MMSLLFWPAMASGKLVSLLIGWVGLGWVGMGWAYRVGLDPTSL